MSAMMLQSKIKLQKLSIVVVCGIFISFLLLHQARSTFRKSQPPFLEPIAQDTTTYTSQTPGVAKGYSIKPIAYIFPQYYPFEDNDKLHGQNFTEWNNVKKVTHNKYGLETIRPHESFGYYNGLEFKTRQRQGKFLNDHGFYGAVFHHYWFDGRPVMDHIIKAMLEDGEPDVNFMLSCKFILVQLYSLLWGSSTCS